MTVFDYLWVIMLYRPIECDSYVLVFTKCSEADDVERRQGYKVRVRT